MSTLQDNCETGACLPDVHVSNSTVEDPTNWRTFTPPPFDVAALGGRLSPSVVIEFCNRCRWLHRATWVQTELFLTFEDKSAQPADDSAQGKYATGTGVKSIQLIPCNAADTGGRFRVWLYRDRNGNTSESTSNDNDKNAALGSFDEGKVVLLWDRKIRGGFPELKELKQIVRDQIAPLHSLGHSDRHT